MPKRRDGFEGEKLISLPESVWKKAIAANPFISKLYITHIGYFPNASHHFRDRRKGCSDNILFYCLRGKGWYSVKGKHFEVSANQFFIIPATKEHVKYGADEIDPWTIYWVHFTGSEIDFFNRCFKITTSNGPQNILFNEKGIRLWEEMYEDLEMGYGFDNLARANLCLYDFVATFIFPQKHIDESKEAERNMINQTVLFMRDHIADRMSVDELAKKHQLSASHFTLLFRKATGMSPLDYFIHLKLQKACLLLQTTDILIKDVSDKLGYDDAYYFSRLFKKYMQVSPDQYRFLGRKEKDVKMKKLF